VMQKTATLGAIHIGLAAMALGFWPLTATAEDAQSTLAETLAWMDSTFNPHSSEGGSFGYGVEENYLKGKLTKRRSPGGPPTCAQ